MKPIHFFLLFFLFISNYGKAQCVFVGDSAGSVANSDGTANIDFNVSFLNGAYYVNLNQVINYCGFDFPNTAFPFTGNTTPSTVTYTFSVPLTSVDIAIGAAGLNGNVLPETFVFTTDAGTLPSLFANSGSCAAWTILGNQSTSPSIVGAVNSVHTVSSVVPFNSVTISSTDNNIHGGSVFALCDGSLIQDCPAQTFNLGNDTSICSTGSIILDATTTNATYLWQDGSNSSQYTVTQSGQYWVSINQEGCFSFDSISISLFETPISTIEELVFCTETDSKTLHAKYDDSYTYLWQDGTTNSYDIIYTEGVYSVEISNFCGSSTSEFIVENAQCFCEVYIPNSFTPDGNENNNDLAVFSICELSQYQFEVFDRWGELMFVSKDHNAFWDGSFQGKTAPSGVYTWKLTYSLIDKNTQVKVGHVSLLK